MTLSKIYINEQDTGFDGIPLQETGESMTRTMSQKAITKELVDLSRELQPLLKLVRSDFDDSLIISDFSGNVIAKFDENGLYVDALKVKNTIQALNIKKLSVQDVIESLEVQDLTIGSLNFFDSSTILSVAALAAISIKSTYIHSEEKSLTVCDLQGNVVLTISNRGLKTIKVIASILYTSYIFSDENCFVISDANGNVGMKLTAASLRTHTLQADVINGANQNTGFNKTTDISEKFKTDFTAILSYGQSLGNACYSGNAVSKSPIYSNLFSFKGGTRAYDLYYLNQYKYPWVTRTRENPQYGEFIDYKNSLSQLDIDIIDLSYSELIPLIQKRQYYSSFTSQQNPQIYYKADNTGNVVMLHNPVEVPLSGTLEMLDSLIIREDNFNIETAGINFIAQCPAFGSASFSNLMPLNSGGTIHSAADNQSPDINYFEQLSLDVLKGVEYCSKIGKSYSVGAVLYYHEGDFSGNKMVRKSARQRLFTRINQLIKSLTGQTNDVIFILHQSSLNEDHNEIDLELSIETEPNQYTQQQEQELEQAFLNVTPTGGVSLYQAEEYDKSKIVIG